MATICNIGRNEFNLLNLVWYGCIEFDMRRKAKTQMVKNKRTGVILMISRQFERLI